MDNRDAPRPAFDEPLDEAIIRKRLRLLKENRGRKREYAIKQNYKSASIIFGALLVISSIFLMLYFILEMPCSI